MSQVMNRRGGVKWQIQHEAKLSAVFVMRLTDILFCVERLSVLFVVMDSQCELDAFRHVSIIGQQALMNFKYLTHNELCVIN